MSNKDHAELAILMFHNIAIVELIANAGGTLGIYWYEYTVFIPKLQDALVGGDRDKWDGIHQYDFDKYAGTGETLEEAWDDFTGKNIELLDSLSNMDEDEWPEIVEQYCTNQSAGSEL